ncbi:GFA family protein [Pikeienuella piscinae]|uniref:GFA family protein n=1 Tax=Pikeienuella piscinae TaxID=2748098 RepID=A0A7L5C108_9RHOB|nr:GFA family protein [Pikeienuella piscinae]QIE55539.1 GFA family protein [Pikeienuella piscinae]
MPMSGTCLCGAVSYEIAAAKSQVGACHCRMCQAWSGGVFIGLRVASDEVTLKGEENLTVYRSSDWAERGFCATCGSSLFYRITAPGPMQDEYHFGAGTLDDWGDLKMNEEFFIDRKPAAYAFAGDRKTMTSDEVFALFASKG